MACIGEQAATRCLEHVLTYACRRALNSPCQISDHRLVWQHHGKLATPLATSQRRLGRVCRHLANSGARWQDVAGRASYSPIQHLLGLCWLHLTRALMIRRKKNNILNLHYIYCDGYRRRNLHEARRTGTLWGPSSAPSNSRRGSGGVAVNALGRTRVARRVGDAYTVQSGSVENRDGRLGKAS